MPGDHRATTPQPTLRRPAEHRGGKPRRPAGGAESQPRGVAGGREGDDGSGRLVRGILERSLGGAEPFTFFFWKDGVVGVLG